MFPFAVLPKKTAPSLLDVTLSGITDVSLIVTSKRDCASVAATVRRIAVMPSAPRTIARFIMMIFEPSSAEVQTKHMVAGIWCHAEVFHLSTYFDFEDVEA